MEKCGNCAWYCHAEGKCYGTVARLYGVVTSMEYRDVRAEACKQWQFDGLTEQEREEYLNSYVREVKWG